MFSDFLGKDERILDALPLQGDKPLKLKIGCYKLEIDAPGYVPVKDSYLFILPVNENPHYREFNRRTIEYKLILKIRMICYD